MDSNEAKTILGILAELMDEQAEHTEQEAQVLALYNEMRNEINTGLISAVERISYEKKYAVIDSANGLADSIGLYLNYPELIDKYVIGFYAPNAVQVKSICARYLRSAGGVLTILKQKLGLSDASGGLSDTIPTILAYGEDHGQIRALNLAEKHISLSPESYAVLEPGKRQEVELAGILVSYCLSSPAVLEHQAVLVLPKGMDRQQDYHRVLIHAMDTLVVPCSEVDSQLAERLRGGNIKLILAMGKCNDIQKEFVTAVARKIKSELIFVNALSDVYEILQAPERNTITNNFSNEVLMESCLSSILWHLAEQKKLLSGRVAQINKDLLGGDSKARTLTKKLQKRTGDQVRELDECADAYYASMQNILKQINGLQQLHGNPSGDVLNGRVAMYDHLLDILAAEGAFFQHYRKSNASNDHIRSIEALCEQTDGDQAVVHALVNDYYSYPQADRDLEAFAKYRTQSPLLLKKKLEMYKQLKISVDDCAHIIDSLDMPRSPMEYRLLGEAQYKRGQTEPAKENLKKALVGGDQEAGKFLYEVCKSDVGLVYLADNGVAEAAYEYGHDVYNTHGQTHNKEMLDAAKKYLHIAAVQEHIPALELLGDIWFEHAMAGQGIRKESLKTALSYYTVVQKKKNLKNATKERMGIIYFEQEDYPRARSSLESANTPQALFLLGQMYENGQGVAANQEKALEYYEDAMDKGHSQAQVEYSRLYAVIEAEKKKNIVESNTSYYSSSYYSSSYYSSSYYSGW